MGAGKPRLGAKHLRGLVISIVLLTSGLLLFPQISLDATGLTPQFSRPNVKVDLSALGVDASTAGGPSIAVGVGGILHAVWSDTRTPLDKGIYYAQSYDSGLTWIGEARMDGSAGFANVAPSIAVDATGGLNNGNIYVAWQKGEGSNADVWVKRSVDGGASWTSAFRVDSASFGIPSAYPRLAVDGLGTVYVAFMDRRSGDDNIYFSRSDDGGGTWRTDTTVASGTNFDGYPSISAYGNLVCIAWEEHGSVNSRLWTAVSTDKGATWNRQIVVSVDLSLGDVSWVSVMVDDLGAIHTAYVYQDQLGISSVQHSKSTDNGLTWSVPAKVSDGPSVTSYIPHSITILKSSSVLYAVWADNRNGDHDVFASWSEDDGATWGDGTPNNDIRVDDTDENVPTTDDSTFQTAPAAAGVTYGVYVIWSDNRDMVAYHAYFAAFELREVMITEVTDSPDGMEQVELYNRVGKNIDLAGWSLEVDGVPVDLSPLVKITPKAYRTVGDPASSDLQAAITLRDEGGMVRLLDGTGLLRDSIAYGQLGPAPDPLTSESVSRVLFNGAYLSDWTRSSTRTFGADNVGKQPISNSSVVINEVFYNAVNPNRRFIEIEYRSNKTQDLTGWVLVGDSTYIFPAMTLTDADSYFLIYPPQALALFSMMDVTGDNLYLYDSTGALADKVGWSGPHTQDTSMCRVPDGFGTPNGFDDPTSIASGWQFNCIPSPHLIGIGPPGTVYANLGDTVEHNLNVTNYKSVATVVDLSWNSPPAGWSIAMFMSDGVTPVPDTNGNFKPDVSLGPYGAPNYRTSVVMKVSVPWTPPPEDSIVTKVVAETQPEGRDTVGLVTAYYPYLEVDRRADPTTIYVKGTGYNEQTTISLNLSGRGVTIPGKGANIADVVFVIDDTGSMGSWIDSVKTDVDFITDALIANVSDLRLGLVSFGDVFEINVDTDLVSDVSVFKSALMALIASGGGDLPEDPDIALQTAANLSWRWGDTPKVMILVSDAPAHDNTHLAMVARWAYNVLNIHTSAIGCGPDINMINAFQATAAEGHGYFVDLSFPGDMAEAIIKGIMTAIPPIDFAAKDTDISDGDPMVQDVLPPYIEYVPGTFKDPVTMAAKNPNYIAKDASGNTYLQWNVSLLKVNRTWSVQFDVKSTLTGLVLTNVYGASRVSFINWSGAHIMMSFPKVWVTVIPAPPLPDLTLTTSDITLFPPSPYREGYQLFINATIHNIGQNASAATIVRFHDGTPPAPQIGANQPLGVLGIGGTQEVSVVWTPTLTGLHNLCVVVDPTNTVREESETNNMACLSVNIAPTKPDYAPDQPQPAATRKIGLSLTLPLSIQIKNIGDRPASASSTLVFRNETGSPFAVFTVPAMLAGETSSRYNVSWKVPSIPGSYNVYAMVDFYNSIAEWDETNNAYKWIIEAVPGPVTKMVIGVPNYTASYTYIKSSTFLNFDVKDLGGTGIRRTMYRIDYGEWRNYTALGQFWIQGDGEHTVEWYSEDYAGNVEAVNNRTLRVDDSPPDSVVNVGDPKYTGASGGKFVRSITPLTLQSSDAGVKPVGLNETFYRTWNGVWSAWSTYASPFRLGVADGTRRVEFYSIDLLGNKENVLSVTLLVDDTPPTTNLVPEGTGVTLETFFEVTANDGPGSGVRSMWYSVDGGILVQYSVPFTLSRGTHTIVYKSADNLGNAIELRRDVNVISKEIVTVFVKMNYKPTIAFIFSLIIVFTAIPSARKRPLRWGKSPARKFLIAWSLLAVPFIIAEAVTAVISIGFEPMRVPPLIGWGMGIDGLILAMGLAILIGRLARKRKAEAGVPPPQSEPEPPPPESETEAPPPEDAPDIAPPPPP